MLRGELRSRSDFGFDRTEYADSGADRADRGECIDLPEREQTCPGGGSSALLLWIAARRDRSQHMNG